MEITKDTVIGELVAKDYKTASIFKKYGIDFCCQGNRSIDNACTAKNVDTTQLLADLNALSENNGAKTMNDYNSWDLDLLADYIEKRHHRFVEEKITEITPYLEKVTRVHGKHHPELIRVLELFNESVGNLTQHMKKEELMLFPFIRKMVDAKRKNAPLERRPHFGTVENPVGAMMHEHTREGEIYREISELTNGYETPEDGCNTYRVTLNLLKEFEDDLHLHIHLENNILFPKAIALENQLD